MVESETGSFPDKLFINKENIINTATRVLGRDLSKEEEKRILDSEVARELTTFALKNTFEETSKLPVDQNTEEVIRRTVAMPISRDFDPGEFNRVNMAFKGYHSKRPLAPGTLIDKLLMKKLNESPEAKAKFEKLRYPTDPESGNYLKDDGGFHGI
ncbi:MAG: hypothetical protein MK033_06015 [Candidatus Caenarcaniphilales bacterium]|nr:hypothetical protein [Candidatus Caenarcaniphilales bacterium]